MGYRIFAKSDLFLACTLDYQSAQKLDDISKMLKTICRVFVNIHIMYLYIFLLGNVSNDRKLQVFHWGPLWYNDYWDYHCIKYLTTDTTTWIKKAVSRQLRNLFMKIIYFGILQITKMLEPRFIRLVVYNKNIIKRSSLKTRLNQYPFKKEIYESRKTLVLFRPYCAWHLFLIFHFPIKIKTFSFKEDLIDILKTNERCT